jgi:rhamnogalacturonyl hydrolase YesR
MQTCTIRVRQARAHRRIVLALAALFVLLTCSAANAQEKKAPLAPPGDTLTTPGPLAQNLSPRLDMRDLAKAMKLVADWQLGRMPVDAQTDWTWAALYDGFMAVPEKVSGDKYRKAMLGIADQLKWQPGPHVMHADDQAVGQMYMEQYFLHKYPKMMEAMRARLDTEIATPEAQYAGTLPAQWDNARYPNMPLWWWCDALFMAPPVFADMAAATGDQKYLTFMDRSWDSTAALLYDHANHLYFRDATFLDEHEKNGEPLFWARGNGWVMGGIVRVLQKLPADSPLRPKYVALLKDMAAEMISIQGKDGLWRPGLLDADAYPLPEISGSAFVTYALAYGVNEGILDRATYGPAVEKAWAGMLTHVYADGRLGSIQPVGAAPGAYSETSSYVYGVGAYLLAGSEIYRTAK